jgi:hypothetical protein
MRRGGGSERGGNLIPSVSSVPLPSHSVVTVASPPRAKRTLQFPACRRSSFRRVQWLLLLALPLIGVVLLVGINSLLWIHNRELQGGQHNEKNDAFPSLVHYGMNGPDQDSPFSLPQQRAMTKTTTTSIHQRSHHHPTELNLAQHKHAAKAALVQTNASPFTLPRIPGVSPLALRSILQAQVHLIELSTTDFEKPTETKPPQDHNGHQHHHHSTTTAAAAAGGPLYSNVYATFCRVDWSLYQDQPNDYPFFHDLVAASHDCQESHRIANVPLHTMAALARRYDADAASTKTTRQHSVRTLNFTAAVFHESRCGSTLTANLLVAMHPTKHRVYAEATPANDALHHICGDDYQDCSMETAVAMLRDVVYLMSRTDDVQQERVFFKFQAAAARALPVFTKAFPTTPYLFVYREPVQVIMSHLQNGMEKANCLRSMDSPPASVEHIVAKYNRKRVGQRHRAVVAAARDRHHHHRSNMESTLSLAQQLAPEDYCAAHLASIAERVVSHLTRPMGRVVNYRDLPNAYYTNIFPQLLGQPLSRQQLADMQHVATLYSKNRKNGDGKRGSVANDGQTFRADSEHKERQASHAVRRAAQIYLAPSYQALETMAGTSSRQSSVQ